MPRPLDASISSSLLLHSGALGDFILTWPLLRALLNTSDLITLIAAPAHAHLATRIFSTPRLRTISKEHREVTRLWLDEPATTADRAAWAALLGPEPITHIYSFLGDDDSPTSRRFRERLLDCTAAASLTTIGPPGSPSRAAAWSALDVAIRGRVAPRPPGLGPAILHVGAGSRAKRWPLEHWRTLIDTHPFPRGIRIIAGEVEAEQFTPDEHRQFAAIRGDILPTLNHLLDLLTDTHPSLFIGADTGPTHLAAQLALPTLALFGPTDPTTWSPIGPAAQVIRSPTTNMHDLTPATVAKHLLSRHPKT